MPRGPLIQRHPFTTGACPPGGASSGRETHVGPGFLEPALPLPGRLSCPQQVLNLNHEMGFQESHCSLRDCFWLLGCLCVAPGTLAGALGWPASCRCCGGGSRKMGFLTPCCRLPLAPMPPCEAVYETCAKAKLPHLQATLCRVRSLPLLGSYALLPRRWILGRRKSQWKALEPIVDKHSICISGARSPHL